MTAAELRVIMLENSLTRCALASLVRVSERQVYRYLSGSAAIPEPVARLLLLEVELCWCQRLAADKWQGVRDGRRMGPVVATKWEAMRWALDLPR